MKPRVYLTNLEHLLLLRVDRSASAVHTHFFLSAKGRNDKFTREIYCSAVAEVLHFGTKWWHRLGMRR